MSLLSCSYIRDSKKEILFDYHQDNRYNSKMLLSSGSICDSMGNVFILDSVINAESYMLKYYLDNLNNYKRCNKRKDSSNRFKSLKSYLPMDGSYDFINSIHFLIWDNNYNNHIQSIQAPGGTCTIRVAADTIRRVIHQSKNIESNVWVSSPTWGNHIKIFKHSGYNINTYTYNGIEKSDSNYMILDFKSLIESLKDATEYSVILFQGNCHNPTGLDLSYNQWEELYLYCQTHSLFLLVDMAFVGMANGVDEDFRPFRYLSQLSKDTPSNIPWFFAVSYSKCFTMYNERVGSLSIISSEEYSINFKTQMKLTARAMYSNPPARGAEIITYLLNNKELLKQWKKEIKEIGQDIKNRREVYINSMSRYIPKKELSLELLNRNTIFLHIGLTKEQNQLLRSKYALYNWEHHFNILTIDINSMDYVVDCIASVKDKQ